MYCRPNEPISVPGRSPQGERGLKLQLIDRQAQRLGRSPQGERGLKYCLEHLHAHILHVAPRKGSAD